MIQAVSRQPLNTEDRVRSHVSPYAILADKVAQGQCFSQHIGFPCQKRTTGDPYAGVHLSQTLVYLSVDENAV